MYIPEHFAVSDVAALHALIRGAPLATLVVSAAGELVVNHIPFVLVCDDDRAKLQAHVPRANPLAALLRTPQKCVAVFHGAQGYISPAWYATKRVHGRVVPTWNYAVVHAHGTISAIDDAAWVMNQVQTLTRQQESEREDPWSVADAPAAFTTQLVGALVGLEIVVTQLEGKTKASQNQPPENRCSLLRTMSAEQPDAPLTDLMRDVLGDGG